MSRFASTTAFYYVEGLAARLLDSDMEGTVALAVLCDGCHPVVAATPDLDVWHAQDATADDACYLCGSTVAA